jgi:hypothetical protein
VRFAIGIPLTEDETNVAIRGVWATCCGALRYGGNDPRNCARFEYVVPNGVVSRRKYLRQIINHIAESVKKYPGSECFDFHRWWKEASFRLRWGKFGNQCGSTVRFKVIHESAGWWLLRIIENDVACTAFAIQIDKALQQKDGFRSIRWFEDDNLPSGGDRGQRHPY